jgi:hypothetical protein
MQIQIRQTITNVMDESRKPISSFQSEIYVLIPDEGKALINKTTKRVTKGVITLSLKSKLSDYGEVPADGD